jgi:hypothetical protein
LSSGCAWGILDVCFEELLGGSCYACAGWFERVRLVALASVAVLDGERLGCYWLLLRCAFEVEGADACRSAAAEARALVFTTPPFVVGGDVIYNVHEHDCNACAGTFNKCKYHMSYTARLTGRCYIPISLLG